MIPEHLTHRYDVCLKHIPIGSWIALTVAAIRDPDVLIDQIDPDTFEDEERLPYWAEIWPAAIGMACHLFEHPIRTEQPVLELGCGIGVAGIAAAKTGLAVHACDYDRDALAFARHNASINQVADQMTFQHFNWRTSNLTGRYRMVLGSDIVYERPDHQPIIDLLEKALVPGGTFLLSDPDRRPARAFVDLMKQCGYCHSTQPHRIRFDGSNNRIIVHRFIKNR